MVKPFNMNKAYFIWSLIGAVIGIVLLVVKLQQTKPSCITPSVWGPHAWKFLHAVAAGYPESPTIEEAQQYRQFVTSLIHVLPCYQCSDNLQKHLNEMPITNEALKNRKSFTKYMFDLHNLVNKELGKKQLKSVNQIYCR